MSQFVWEEQHNTCWTQFFINQPIQWNGDAASARIDAWNIADLSFVQGYSPPFRLERTIDQTVDIPLRQFCISVLLHGSITIGSQGRSVTYGAGDLLMIDDSEPYSIDAEESAFASILFPRRLILERWPEIGAYPVTATRADSLSAVILMQLLEALVRNGRSDEGPADRWIRDAVIALVIGTIESQDVRDAKTSQDSTLHQRVRIFVMKHLTEPDLSPDRIASGAGISRSSLYRAFVSTGGVSRFVQNCRIDRIRTLLTDPNERRSITELALTFGFMSSAHFSRVFRERTGRLPRDFRNGSKGGDSPGRTEDSVKS